MSSLKIWACIFDASIESLSLFCRQICSNKPSVNSSKHLGKCPWVVWDPAPCLPCVSHQTGARAAPGSLSPGSPWCRGQCPLLVAISSLSSVPKQVKPHWGSLGHIFGFAHWRKVPGRAVAQSLKSWSENKHHELPATHKIIKLLLVSHRPVFIHHRLVFYCFWQLLALCFGKKR